MAITAETTARDRRETARKALSRLLRKLLDRHAVSLYEVHRATGAAESIVQRWCDPERQEAPSLADVLHLKHTAGGAAVARELLEEIAGELGLELRERVDVTESTGITGGRVVDLTREVHEAVQKAQLLVLQRGQSLQELTDADRELGEAGREISDFRAVIQRAIASIRKRLDGLT